MLMSSSKNFKVNKYVYCGVDPMPQRTRTHNWNQSVAVKISSCMGTFISSRWWVTVLFHIFFLRAILRSVSYTWGKPVGTSCLITRVELSVSNLIQCFERDKVNKVIHIFGLDHFYSSSWQELKTSMFQGIQALKLFSVQCDSIKPRDNSWCFHLLSG